MWRRVLLCSVSSLHSHLIGYRLTAGETQAVPSEQPLRTSGDFFYLFFSFPPLLFFASSIFFFSKFRRSSVRAEKHSFSPMQISACGKYRDRVTFHPAVPSANQAAVGGERLPPLFFLLVSKESLLVKHPLLGCTDIEYPKNSFFFFFFFSSSPANNCGPLSSVSHIFLNV